MPAARSRLVALAAVLDLACVLGFAAAGRSAHAEDGGVVGVLGTAWPFLVAAAVGWAALPAWRDPVRVWPTGVTVWAVTWGLGLALRGLTGGGLAIPFVVVAAAVLAVAMVGWRAVLTAVTASARRRQVGDPARAR